MSTQSENPLVKVLKKSVGISSGGCCGPKVAADTTAAVGETEANKAGAQPSEAQAEGACCGEKQEEQAGSCCG